MTSKEAKHFLREFLGDKPNFREERPGYAEEVHHQMDMLAEAIDVAISALELVTINTESDEIKVTNCNDKDTIYRQDAIDAIASYERDSTAPINYRKIIEELPSVQPDPDEWCHDCKEYDQERHCCPRWNRVIRKTLEDAQMQRGEQDE